MFWVCLFLFNLVYLRVLWSLIEVLLQLQGRQVMTSALPPIPHSPASQNHNLGF